MKETMLAPLVPDALLYHLCLSFHAIPLAPDADGKYVAVDGSFTHAEYRELNPTGYVPALDIGNGTIIAETLAILTCIV